MSPTTVPGKMTLAKEFTWNETLWNPSMISTALWLDAADASTITLNGSNVSQWNDKSGNGRHFINNTSSSQPFRSINAVDFDGVNDFLSASITLSQPLNVYYVSRLITRETSGQRYMFGIGDSFDFASNNNNTIRIFSGTSLAATDLTQTSTSIYSLIYNGASSSIAKNGSTLASGNAGITALNGTCRLGSFNGGGSYNANLRIYEILIAGATVTNRKVEGYLAHKWGLTANLPNDHPYKLVGPTP